MDFSGVKQIPKRSSHDNRGSFYKLFDTGFDGLSDFNVQQANYVHSKINHTLRGLHYQVGDAAESKFFSVMSGKIQLAFIDLRLDSDTSLKAGFVILESPEMGLVIPRGFATGYCTLMDDTMVLYFSDNKYNAGKERGIRWDDPFFNISWLTKHPVLSEKDKGWPNWT